MPFRSAQLVAVAVFGLVTFSCNCDEGKITVAINPPSAVLAEGASVTFAATVTGNPNHEVSWSVQESGGGTIDSGGKYTAPSSAGTFHVFAAAKANAAVTASATVTVNATGGFTVEVTPAQLTVALGSSTPLTAVVRDSTGATVSVQPTWSSTSPGVASVSVAGVVTAVAPGTATISAAYGGATGFSAITVSTATGNGPTLTCAEPPFLEVGSGPQTVTVRGTGFASTVSAQVNGSDRQSNLLGDRVAIGLTSGDLSSVGVAQLTVLNPPPDGGVSNSVSVSVRPVATRVLVSTALDGDGGNGQSIELRPSRDGRFVAFSSLSTDLVAGDTRVLGMFQEPLDVFLRDTCVGADAGCVPSTVLVSEQEDGGTSPYAASAPSISADGRFVAFTAYTQLRNGDDAGHHNTVFLRDTCAGVAGCVPSTVRVAVANDGTPADDTAESAVLSSDGRFVAFVSSAPSLGVTTTYEQLFVRDTCLGATGCTPSTRAALPAADGGWLPGNVTPSALSSSGRYLVLWTDVPLVADDLNGRLDVFLRDTCTGAASGCVPGTTRLSLAADGGDPDGDSYLASVSLDGRFVAFQSGATNIAANDLNTEDDIFVRDTCLGAPTGCQPATTQISVNSCSEPYGEANRFPTISADGRFVAFQSYTTSQVFVLVRDTCLGVASCVPTTTRIALEQSTTPMISGDGRWVGFTSTSDGDLRLLHTPYP